MLSSATPLQSRATVLASVSRVHWVPSAPRHCCFDCYVFCICAYASVCVCLCVCCMHARLYAAPTQLCAPLWCGPNARARSTHRHVSHVASVLPSAALLLLRYASSWPACSSIAHAFVSEESARSSQFWGIPKTCSYFVCDFMCDSINVENRVKWCRPAYARAFWHKSLTDLNVFPTIHAHQSYST